MEFSVPRDAQYSQSQWVTFTKHQSFTSLADRRLQLSHEQQKMHTCPSEESHTMWSTLREPERGSRQEQAGVHASLLHLTYNH